MSDTVLGSSAGPNCRGYLAVTGQTFETETNETFGPSREAGDVKVFGSFLPLVFHANQEEQRIIYSSIQDADHSPEGR